MLDAAGVFNGGETEGFFVVAEAVPGVVVELFVVVAVRPALKGGRLALRSPRHNMTAFGVHGVSP
jgi:hypothetical protein